MISVSTLQISSPCRYCYSYCHRPQRLVRSSAESTRSLSEPALPSRLPKQVHLGTLQYCAAAALALQIALLPAGAALAQLDTSTNKAGVGAKVEYSDLKNEDGAQALNKLVQELIPQAQSAIEKMDASDKVTTAKQELGKVKEVARNLQQRASKGATQSEIRSGVSGTEQQLNALKAIVGLN